MQSGRRPNDPITGPGEAEILTVPLVEEHAEVELRSVEKGRVRVSTHTEVVEEHIRGSVLTDNVSVERVRIDRTLSEGESVPTIRTEGDVTIIPVLEEVLIAEKRIVLKEELRISKNRSVEHVELPIQLRKQKAVIERSGPDNV